MLGNVNSPKLRFWYHICVHIDLDNATISAAVNGQGFSLQSNIHVFFSFNHVVLGLNTTVASQWKSRKPEGLENRLYFVMFVLLTFVDVTVGDIHVEQFDERLVLGKFNSTWGDLRAKQFKGSVSNIQVFTNFNSFIEALFTYFLD